MPSSSMNKAGKNSAGAFWNSVLTVVPLVLWVGVAMFAPKVAASVDARLGARILAVADGKFAEVRPFLEHRCYDFALIVTAACLLILVFRTLNGWISRRVTTPGRWVLQGWSAFVCLNVFVGVAAHTALFWCVLYTGKNKIEMYTQWRVKQALMREASAPSQAVLLGASQTRTEIDSRVLNTRLGRKIWTSELHFPGSSPYDMTLCLERLPNVKIDYVITYVSEANFYSDADSERLMYFFGIRDLLTYQKLGPGRPRLDSYALSGLLGDTFPVYQVWDSVAARARVWETDNAAQADYDSALGNILELRAKRAAGEMHLGPGCDFNKREFEVFAQMCRKRGARWIICCGQSNPVLDRALDPALHQDMLAFLREEARKDTNIVLLEPSDLPAQDESDYVDLMHVNLETRQRFSEYMAGVLENLVEGKNPADSLSKKPSQNEGF